MKDDQDKQSHIKIAMSDKLPNRPGLWLFRGRFTGDIETIQIIESLPSGKLMSTVSRTNFANWQGQWSTAPIVCR